MKEKQTGERKQIQEEKVIEEVERKSRYLHKKEYIDIVIDWGNLRNSQKLSKIRSKTKWMKRECE